MDENAIFRDVNISQGQENVQPEIPEKNPIVSPPPPKLPSAPLPSKLSQTLKVLLGIAIILGIILLVYKLVLPKLFPTKIGQITLTYWGTQEDISVMTPVIADFEKKHPNIKIEYSKQDQDQYRDKLVTRTKNGNGPDIFGFHNTWIPQLSDLLLPLPESVISKDDFFKNYYPVIKTDLIRGGAIYGVPLQVDTLNLYINRDLFQAAGLTAPTTWTDFVSYAKQLTVKDENNNIKTAGTAMGTSSNINHAPDIISMLFAQNGVDLNDLSSNAQATSDALSFYTSFALPKANVWDETLDQSIRAFSAGTLAMYFGYSWDFFTIKSMNPNLSFDVYPVPSLPGQNITIASYWAEGVSSKTKHQKEAFIFMQYLAQKETTQKLFIEESKTRNFGVPYARMDLADSLSNTIAYSFVQNASSAISSYFVDGTYDNGLNTKANSYLNAAVESILRGTSSQEATETFLKNIPQVLNQYGL